MWGARANIVRYVVCAGVRKESIMLGAQARGAGYVEGSGWRVSCGTKRVFSGEGA